MSEAQPAAPPRRPLSPVPGGWLGRPLAETRWALEAGRLLVDPVAYGLGVPRGDGRAVVVLPGFLAGDDSLLLLRRWLRLVGHRPQTVGFTMNVDCSDRAVERVEQVLEALHAESGRRAAVIGHSRGGHFARAVSARRPDLVSHAISMGADLQGLFGISTPTKMAVGVARRGLHLARRSRDPACFRSRCACRFMEDYRRPFPVDRVRLTSIYSKGDGVVRWERAVVEEATCVEVTGSHIGLMANRKAYRAIAAALAEPELAGEGDPVDAHA
ncbi:alpha/beta hydrolase [Conexibacter sp. SYSU D00693]|uniref:alpha/beta hydrolase n=1 Tax=Conexibacter sp. SYSU D00693 TaxID=2812560 RepID=UPI00196B4D55|nr:alpha/beta hydrolase [Conexibacter sp. SYSU D00693]